MRQKEAKNEGIETKTESVSEVQPAEQKPVENKVIETKTE